MRVVFGLVVWPLRRSHASAKCACAATLLCSLHLVPSCNTSVRCVHSVHVYVSWVNPSILCLLAPLGHVAVRLVCSSCRSCARASISSDVPFGAPRLLFRRPGSCGSLAFFCIRRREIIPFALPDRVNTGRCCGQIGG
jgi:hypothetical protein